MANKTPPLSQVQKLLLCGALAKLTQAEWSVFAVLLSCDGFRLRDERWLYNEWPGYRERNGHRGLPPCLPLTRPGVQKGLAGLLARGWVETSGSKRRYDPQSWGLLPLVVMQSRLTRSVATDVAKEPGETVTHVSQRSARNKRCKSKGGADV